MNQPATVPGGFVIGIVKNFLKSSLSVMLIITALCLGIAAILITPREEEPQIVVPMADIYIQVPGASPEEVEQLAASPLERLLWQIDGVEYVYSMSQRDMAIVTVRFYVGEDRENSLVKLRNKIDMNIDKVSPVIRGWVVKPIEIDDVPIVNIALYSAIYNDHELKRVGEEVLARLSEVEDISGTSVIGGRKREIQVSLSPEKMTGMGISLLEVYQSLAASDASLTAGTFSRFNTEFTVVGNAFISSAEETASLVVGVTDGRPVYLRDIADITDGPEEATSYSKIGFSSAYRQKHDMTDEPLSCPAVTLALSKKKGTNAVSVSEDIMKKMETLSKTIIPDGIKYIVTRNYGETAREKVNELLSSLGFAIISVVILLMFTLGWKESLVVAMAVPISFALALFCNYFFGYTINRVTLFALILSLGLVVDDPIMNVDNIQRNIIKGVLNPFDATLYAVKEILTPVVMSTIAIIVCFVPLFFITGMMGPYMAPMAINVPLTIFFSMVAALTVVPWLSHMLLKNIKSDKNQDSDKQAEDLQKTVVARVYRKILGFFLFSSKRRKGLGIAVVVLLLLSCMLGAVGLVPLKLLPFDNKNEFQLVIDMPEGSTLEHTEAVVTRFEEYLRKVPEVTSFVTYTGTASPMDFNGMVRHYYLRSQSNLADIRVNLLDKSERKMQSHAIVLRLRSDLEAIAAQEKATLKIVEVPPGPPVLSTIVAEVYGSPSSSYQDLIEAGKKVQTLLKEEAFVSDIDSSDLADRERVEITVDREKAALHGVRVQDIISTIKGAVGGLVPAQVHLPGERKPLNIKIILPISQRSGIVPLSQIPVKGMDGSMVPLAEIVTIRTVPDDQPIYHKNLDKVVFVYAEMAGRAPAEAILSLQSKLKKNPLDKDIRVNWAGEGEWKITLRVFRDMGLAFAAALVGLYLILIIQSGSLTLPILIMVAIPLTLLGIMPGFFFLNLVAGETINGFQNPIFFTATSMIGMIALGGIVIRNSLILIEFIQDSVKQGLEFKEAIFQSGTMRLRPILLTALTTAIGAVPITLDPVFSGLAWALIFGLMASTLFTLVIIPVTYYALYKDKEAH
ncbi:MAG: efflux RND transporter permease subunit [Proteobacteria bacterium]|nr:efflux RND transporter permease subunit [Pseudomonadota bacterium]